MIFEIKNLKARVNGKEILKGINLEIKKGEIQAILGPNASGKTALSQVILGNPKYKIEEGEIIFNKKNITKLASEKRVGLGIVLAWQSPPSIRGLKLSQILNKISKRKEFKIKEMEYLLDREINLDFSGGEKKMAELLQIVNLNPALVIFDEIDSGLDIKKLELVSKIIKKELSDKKVSLIFITHSGAILNFFKPQITNILVDGRIICKNKDYEKVLKTIRKYGYEKCKECK